MTNWGQGDVYEQESQARDMDKAHADRERNMEYCEKCKRFISRYLPHKCEVNPSKDEVG